jgi:hypothetical protein
MAGATRLKMMIQIQADAVGSDIELRLSDKTANAVFRLNSHDVTILLLKVCQAIQSPPGDPTAPLGAESPTLIAWPSLQVGTTLDGELALRIRPDPLPPMEFRMDDDGARNLIEGLSRGLAMPRIPRAAKPHH